MFHQRFQFFVIKKIRVTRTDVRVCQVFVDFQRTGSYPFAIFIIASVLCNLANVDLRIEVCSKSLMMVTCIAVYNVQILNLIKIMFSCISSIDTASSRVESAAEDSCQTCFFETIVISPLPAVFKMSFIFRLIVGGVQIVHSGFQTSFHNRQILIRESHINHHFGFEIVE